MTATARSLGASGEQVADQGHCGQRAGAQGGQPPAYASAGRRVLAEVEAGGELSLTARIPTSSTALTRPAATGQIPEAVAA
jgi:hypothetical protein